VFDERRWLMRNPVLWFVMPVAVAALGAGFAQEEARMVLALPAVLLALLFGSNLRIQVLGDELVLTYFPLWRRRIPLARIRAAEVVPYDWKRYGGWGLRIGLDGSISYSVWEKQAVRLTLEGQRPVNVGTTRPHELAKALGWGG
jgi:hypothetical protein